MTYVCAICQENIKSTNVSVLLCTHQYCTTCIVQYSCHCIKTGKLSVDCPLCRASLYHIVEPVDAQLSSRIFSTIRPTDLNDILCISRQFPDFGNTIAFTQNQDIVKWLFVKLSRLGREYFIFSNQIIKYDRSEFQSVYNCFKNLIFGKVGQQEAEDTLTENIVFVIERLFSHTMPNKFGAMDLVELATVTLSSTFAAVNIYKACVIYELHCANYNIPIRPNQFIRHHFVENVAQYDISIRPGEPVDGIVGRT